MKKLKYFLLALLLILVVDELIGVARAVLPIFWTSSTGFQARGPVTFAQLASTYDSANNPSGVPQTDGTSGYCSDCKVGVANNVCAGGGNGSPFERVNGVWICGAINAGIIGSVPDPLNVNTINGIGVLPSLNNMSENGQINMNVLSGADTCAKFNAAVAIMQGNAATGVGSTEMYITPGFYTPTTTCMIPNWYSNQGSLNGGNLAIWAYGVTFSPSAVSEVMDIYQGNSQTKLTIYGLKILVSDATQTVGFHFGNAWNTSCVDCSVLSNITSPNPAYQAFYVGNSIAGNDGTFCQSVRMDRCIVQGRKPGTSTANFNVGVAIRGPSANTTFTHGQIFNCNNSVAITDEAAAGTGTMPDKVHIDNNDIEGSVNGAVTISAATNPPQFAGSYQITNNAFEQHPTIINGGSAPTAQPQNQILLIGNTTLSDVAQKIINPAGWAITDLDSAIIGPSGFAGRTFSRGTTFDALQVKAGTTLGIQGSVGITQYALSPVISVTNVCTVGGGETCNNPTPWCYRVAPVDQYGKIGPLDIERCSSLTNNPVTLTANNYPYIRMFPIQSGVQPAGYRVYGRLAGAEQFMNPGGKVVNGTSVSVLNTDSGQATPVTFPPTYVGLSLLFKDTGLLTPSGALPSGNSTGLLFLSPQNFQFGATLAGPGGGAAATNATIGGTGPATAGQTGWAQIKLSDGSAGYIPIWK